MLTSTQTDRYRAIQRVLETALSAAQDKILNPSIEPLSKEANVTEIEVLTYRLSKMERRYFRSKAILFVAILVVASLGLMGQARIPGQNRPPGGFSIENPAGQTSPDFEIRAEKFVLVDDNGKERASLVTDDAGSVYLVMFDAAGKNRLNLSVTAAGPSLALYDASGQARTVVGSTTLVGSRIAGERMPASSIALFDKDGKLLSRQ